MNPKQFTELHSKCWETLKHYVHEADRMCELFGQCQPEPSSIQIRSEDNTATHPGKQCLRQLRRDSPATFRSDSDRLRCVKLNYYPRV
jgi:hypothetical protein